MVMRTWHLWIWPLITWWARFNICIVIFGTTHLVPYVHVSIWLRVQLCFKEQAHQSPTFSSAAQQCFFTLVTPAQVGACLKDMDNTFGMAQDVLHLGHHLRRLARAPLVAYGVGFRHSLYGWKDNFKTLPMELVWGINSSRGDRNRPRNLTSRICPGAATPSFGVWALYRVGAH